MSLRAAGIRLGLAGCLGIAAGLGLWLVRYGLVGAGAAPRGIADYLPCLYATSDLCGAVPGSASLAPILLWGGGALLALGALLGGRGLAESFDRTYRHVTMLLNVIGTVLILAMAVAVNADILGREIANRPIAGVNEFVGLSIVAVVFLQMANTLREDRHVSNDLILAWVGRSRPRVARLFYGLFHLIGAVLMAFIVWYVLPILQENYQGDFYKGTAGVIEIPVWPFMLVVIVGAGATVLQYLLLAAREFRRALGRAA